MKYDDIPRGIVYNITDAEAIEHLTKRIIRIRDAYHINLNEIHYNVIQDNIKSNLIIGHKEGFAIHQIAERIKKELVGLLDITMDQALSISTTEILGSANYSRYLGINKSGFKKKEWYTASDEKVRPLHREMHGKTINVGDVWIFSDGNTLRHPGDYEGPDHLVVNCRCVEVVVPDSHELLL